MALDTDLAKTEDFRIYCSQQDRDLNDPDALECFKNFVIDHGGSLEECL